ncbi:hypothetical protein C8Q74DRAFT_1190515 [Fomes fomentarius]|nr:hypothetical protein C8Q74DRAFT_1190515 [Fomes fomentarius]
MIVADRKHPLGSTEPVLSSLPVPGPSVTPTPPLDDAEAPKYTERAFENVYIPPGGEEPPPDFTPYEAEYFISGKEIVSHDSHLNEDGEALYRFLLSQSTARPEYRMHARGTHSEHRTRVVSHTDSNGHTTHKTEQYTETVTDFDFYLDLTPYIVYGPVHWSLPDAEPAYRGGMVMQVDSNDLAGDIERGLPSGRRKATRQEIKAANERKDIRKACGLPPWVRVDPKVWMEISGSAIPPQPDAPTAELPAVLESSKTLRQWADEYCASDKTLKEFTYTKIVYGWNTANLEQAVRAAIHSVYSHSIYVDFQTSNHKIRIRPDNRFSRMLSNMWIKFLLWILLIYPFIWLYKRFSGGRWQVCGGAYALKTWQLQPPGTVPPPNSNDGRWQQTPQGLVHLIGYREGEWFQQWEATIRGAVRRRVQTQTPLGLGEYAEAPPIMLLDGIRPTLPFVQPFVGRR